LGGAVGGALAPPAAAAAAPRWPGARASLAGLAGLTVPVAGVPGGGCRFGGGRRGGVALGRARVLAVGGAFRLGLAAGGLRRAARRLPLGIGPRGRRALAAAARRGLAAAPGALPAAGLGAAAPAARRGRAGAQGARRAAGLGAAAPARAPAARALFLVPGGEQHVEEPDEQPGLARLLAHRRGAARRHDRDRGRLRDPALLQELGGIDRLDLLGELVARAGVLGQVDLVVAHAADLVVRRLERGVRDQHDLRAVARLEVLHPAPLLVQEVGGH